MKISHDKRYLESQEYIHSEKKFADKKNVEPKVDIDSENRFFELELVQVALKEMKGNTKKVRIDETPRWDKINHSAGISEIEKLELQKSHWRRPYNQREEPFVP